MGQEYARLRGGVEVGRIGRLCYCQIHTPLKVPTPWVDYVIATVPLSMMPTERTETALGVQLGGKSYAAGIDAQGRIFVISFGDVDEQLVCRATIVWMAKA